MKILKFNPIKGAKLFCIAFATLFSYSAQGQLVNSLPINTGYSNITSSTIAIGAQDPNWDIISVSAPLTGGATPYDAWTSSAWSGATVQAGSQWISYDPAGAGGRMTVAGAEYDNTGATMVLRRVFETCEDDDLYISGTLTADNQMNSMTVDGNVIISGTTTLGPHSFSSTAFYTAGIHVIEIEVQNHASTQSTNPIGLSLAGTVASATGSNSIIDRDNYPEYECSSPCEKPCSDCKNMNILPKVIDPATGDLTCSQIFDDGTSVGINTTSGFFYSGGGVFTAGAPGPQAVRLDVNGLTRSISYVATSDKKYKKNITSIENSLDKVMSLRSVEYNWKSDEYSDKGFDKLKHTGFIAQELAEVLPNAVIKDNHGDYAVDYNSIIPVLTQAIQEQQNAINELKEEIKQLKSGKTTSTDVITPVRGSSLFQNAPNPFSEATEINYNVESMRVSANIVVHSLSGEQLATYDIKHAGAGKILINGGELTAGTYLYTLYVDGSEVDTKKMILSK